MLTRAPGLVLGPSRTSGSRSRCPDRLIPAGLQDGARCRVVVCDTTGARAPCCRWCCCSLNSHSGSDLRSRCHWDLWRASRMALVMLGWSSLSQRKSQPTARPTGSPPGLNQRPTQLDKHRFPHRSLLRSAIDGHAYRGSQRTERPGRRAVIRRSASCRPSGSLACPCRRWLACEASSGDRLHPRLTHRACWLDRLGELHDRPSADGAGFIAGAAPGRCRARSDAVTGKSFRRGAGLRT